MINSVVRIKELMTTLLKGKAALFMWQMSYTRQVFVLHTTESLSGARVTDIPLT